MNTFRFLMIDNFNQEIPEGIVRWDGYDDAIIGLGTRCAFPEVLVYDYDKMVQCGMDMNGWTDEESREWVDFNILGCYIDETTPIIVNTFLESDDA